MRVAIIHDWLNGMRGGEKILEVLCELFPGAVIHTLMCDREKLSPVIARMEIRTSPLQRFPLRRSRYRYYLPLFPRLVETFDLEGFDLVFSTSHCVAKGAVPPPGALNICYCLTPMRYVWYFSDSYFGRWGWKLKMLSPVFDYLKRWDVSSAGRVDHWLAISECVAERIRNIYNREADIIYPPVDTAFFTPGGPRGDYYLAVSALVPYKRIDLAVEAFGRLRLPLKIVGVGPELERLRAAAGPGVEFLGWRSNEEIRDLYRGCRAFIFPGEEDFGITPLEAQSCGTPVVAYGKGGALETVIDGKTGVHFTPQDAGALAEAVGRASRIEFEEEALRENALRFSRERFKEKLERYIEGAVEQWKESRRKR